jgi:pyruvate,orthophosphate dikinase
VSRPLRNAPAAPAAAAGRFVYDFDEGSAEMRELLGGKGANLAEMTRLLAPGRVPPGFTITTEACVAYLREGQAPEGMAEAVDAALDRLESAGGRTLGDPDDPLLVSVRSGARVSMPGMLDTVLNLGLNSRSVEGLAARTANERFAWDSYRRLLQMFGNVVRGIPGELFEASIEQARSERGVEVDSELEPEDLRRLAGEFRELIEARTSSPVPDDPRQQLHEAIAAVFSSWGNPRAVEYRKIEGIPEDWGTAATVQQMVFGNTGPRSGSGVAFSRDGVTGGPEPSGDFLFNAQGEDVVAGIRKTEDLDTLRRRLPEAHAALLEDMRTLERRYRDMQDVEFTIEDGRLYLLQARNAKRPAQAAVRFARDAVREGLLSENEALATIEAERLQDLLHPKFDPEASYRVLARGVAASPGAARGAIVMSADEAVRLGGAGEDVILVRPFTEAEDVAGFAAARGIVTSEGGRASHAALIARGMGRPCVSGAAGLHVDPEAGTVTSGETVLREGDVIAIDGTAGLISSDDVPFVEPEGLEDLDAVLGWADERRRLGVRANADTPEDARRARGLGAEGIGLCRTEHMFFGSDRDQLVREAFIAAEEWRRAEVGEERDRGAERRFDEALGELARLQRRDFEAIFEAMGSLPVTIRLLDPPLHEFLPEDVFAEQVASLEAEGAPEEQLEQARDDLALAGELHEANPMLGTRGVRLGILYPPLYRMQVRAIVEAATAAAARGSAPDAEIMIPLIAYETELRAVRADVEAEIAAAGGDELGLAVGTMAELPRTCLLAGRIAAHADFISFGTNDLTQTTIGLSRDDVEGKFIGPYVEGGLIDRSPFETIDEPGVGELVRIGTERGRAANGDLKIGVCGEHGGDPDSIDFFDRLGLDYVSCSPARLPIARLAAAQATLRRSSR